MVCVFATCQMVWVFSKTYKCHNFNRLHLAKTENRLIFSKDTNQLFSKQLPRRCIGLYCSMCLCDKNISVISSLCCAVCRYSIAYRIKVGLFDIFGLSLRGDLIHWHEEITFSVNCIMCGSKRCDLEKVIRTSITPDTPMTWILS